MAKRAYDVVVATARVSVARGVAPTPHAAAIPVTLTTWPASSCVCPPGAVTLTMSGTCVDCQLTPDTRLLSIRDPGDAYASPPDRGRLWCVWEGNPDAITRTLLVYRVYRVEGVNGDGMRREHALCDTMLSACWPNSTLRATEPATDA